MAKREKVVSTGFGLFTMCLTLLIALIVGAAFSVEYESSCSTSESSGKTLCTTRSAWKGFSGIPIEPLAGVAGSIGGALALYFKTRGQQTDE